ncbi:nuclear transport factor 2 family protein [Paenibacillus sp. FSL P2-0136]|uniref:nuclear transport factor 2 family protein n=1 Tax=Paenibacillus sp. FSL P2-0136 TaxID=2975317 RepID=UPI0030D7183F
MSNTTTAGNTTNAQHTDKNITMLNNYFRLYDASRTDDRAMHDLLSLFTQDAEIVSGGRSRTGFEVVIKTFYEHNKDIKHMWDAWVLQPDGSYLTNWAVCGQAADGTVYAKAGIDIMRVNDMGQIMYLKNVQTTEEEYSEFNS